MSHLGDDAEAFFQQGDDGTYEGGPKSLSPSTRDIAHEEDDLTTEVTPELLERRDRLQRIVKGVVGTLGVCVIVLLPFRFGVAGGSSTASAATAIERSTPAPAAVAAAQASNSNLPVVADALPTTPPAAIVAPPAPAEGHRVLTQKHAAPKPVTAHSSSSTRHLGAQVASSLQQGAVRTAPPSANAPLRAVGARRASAAHLPPTASFPD